MKKIIRLFILLFILLSVNMAFAADIKLKWVPNTEPDVLGYKIHYGFAHREYDQVLDVANVTDYVITGLSAGTYYLCVTAYDDSGNESDYSYEIVKELKMGIVTGLVSE